MSPEGLHASLSAAGDKAAVRAELEVLIAGPALATPRDFAAYLGRLFLHYWAPDFTPDQWKLLFADFAHDLAGITASELARVCEEYRQTKGHDFRPKTWQLRELVVDNISYRLRIRKGAEHLLAVLDGEAPLEQPRRLRSMAEILAEHGLKVPAPADSAPPEPINTGRAESIDTAAELVKKLAERGGR